MRKNALVLEEHGKKANKEDHYMHKQNKIKQAG